ncbi:MAG TPA: hypothetical protein ENI30_03000, partial [Gammaproteobacteria bacterium]|nr:hypothetical protein [Gammaproteobacteria bacterium]
RQLERLFQKYLHCSPSRYYLKLRFALQREQAPSPQVLGLEPYTGKCRLVPRLAQRRQRPRQR